MRKKKRSYGSYLYVGIDIAAKKADVHLLCEQDLPEIGFEIPQSVEGVRILLSKLVATRIDRAHCRILMEATGTYWIDLATMLSERGFILYVVNPRQAHHYVQSLPARSKTDKLDAEALAMMASQPQLSEWRPPQAIYYKMRSYLARYDDTVKRITALKNQRHALLATTKSEKPMIELINEEIDYLTLRKEKLNAALADIAQENAEWKKTINLLMSIPGIGLINSCWLTVVTNNFSSCEDVGALVNYLGLAPLHRESGQSVRGRSRISKASNGQVRGKLYMAALSAISCNPVIKKYYDHLINEAHKEGMVALIASMRKLVHICWSVVKHKREFALIEA